MLKFFENKNREAKLYIAGNEVLSGSNPSDYARYLHLMTDNEDFGMQNLIKQQLGYREGILSFLLKI